MKDTNGAIAGVFSTHAKVSKFAKAQKKYGNIRYFAVTANIAQYPYFEAIDLSSIGSASQSESEEKNENWNNDQLWQVNNSNGSRKKKRPRMEMGAYAEEDRVEDEVLMLNTEPLMKRFKILNKHDMEIEVEADSDAIVSGNAVQEYNI